MQDSFTKSSIGPGSLLVYTGVNNYDVYGSVVLLLEHNEKGSMGIKINSPAGPAPKLKGRSISDGGPNAETSERTITVLKNETGKGHPVRFFDDRFNRNAKLERDAANMPDESVKVVKGYVGWHPGALEDRIKEGLWAVIPFNEKLVFKTKPENIFTQAAREAGLHNDLIRFVKNPEYLAEDKGGIVEALKYLEGIKFQPSLP